MFLKSLLFTLLLAVPVLAGGKGELPASRVEPIQADTVAISSFLKGEKPKGLVIPARFERQLRQYAGWGFRKAALDNMSGVDAITMAPVDINKLDPAIYLPTIHVGKVNGKRTVIAVRAPYRARR